MLVSAPNQKDFLQTHNTNVLTLTPGASEKKNLLGLRHLWGLLRVYLRKGRIGSSVTEKCVRGGYESGGQCVQE